METKKLKFPIAVIPLTIDLLLTIIATVTLIFSYSDVSAFQIINVITQLVFVIILFLKRNDIILCVGTIFMMIPIIINIFSNPYVRISNLISLLAYVILLLIISTVVFGNLEKLKPIAAKIYFLPSVLLLISPVVQSICYYAFDTSHTTKDNFISSVILISGEIFIIIGIFFLAKWVIDPYAKETLLSDSSTSSYTATVNAVLDYNEAYCELVKHILLSLFTCGIWTLIWIHKTTKVLNKTPDAEQYDPTKKLLLCMFVPFYMVYWFKKHGERIDKLNAMQNNRSDNATMYLLLGLFIPVVACILMQDNINKLCIAANTAAYTTATVQASAPVNAEKSNVELLKEYKDLLDTGVITQEEFDAKKQQLLNL